MNLSFLKFLSYIKGFFGRTRARMNAARQAFTLQLFLEIQCLKMMALTQMDLKEGGAAPLLSGSNQLLRIIYMIPSKKAHSCLSSRRLPSTEKNKI